MKKTVRKKVERVVHTGGLEGLLNVVAWLVLVLGIVGFLVLWIYGAYAGSGWAGFLAGASQLVTTVIVWAVLRALGEIIRLQKKAVGLNYGGKISEAREGLVCSCETCGEILQYPHWCYTCNRAIEGGLDDLGDAPADEA